MTNKTAWRDVSIILKKQVQEPVYEFEELSEEVQNALISERMESEERYHQDFGYDLDCIFEDLAYTLKNENDFNLTNWKYDISYCQGCGAAIIGEFYSTEGAIKTAEKYTTFTEEEKAALTEWMDDVKVRDNGGHYSHKYTVSIDYDFGHIPFEEYDAKRDFYDELEGKFVEALEQWKNDVSDELYRTLEAEMEYQDSEEAARYFLIDSGYYFADGTEVSGHVA